jgi:eukaryotic-like serine/threonine-protein kinase
VREDDEIPSAKARSNDSPDATTIGGDGVLGSPSASLPRGVPKSIGHYRILRLIGEGGMGAVYEAEQEQPHRLVALKLIKSGFASLELRRRFEQEAQVLGRLQHPGIAQIYEAGSVETEFGPQPYFAMELIAGKPLLEYATAEGLSTRARLELMVRCCEAVHHAHQRGIIHRDLKPANILVDANGQAKILDFGVARISDSDAQVTRQTGMGQLVGTLPYMSPEQVTGDPLDVDTRTDVYALGVILYELLAGHLPYEVNRWTLPEAVRVIREQDAAPLSSVSRVYRGDIETIVAKALDKDKTRRYASASDLAADIRRYLSDEPILARPPSTVYQLRKFARRNRALVAGTAAVFIVLLGGIAISSWQSLRARRAERSARLAEVQARSERDRAVKAEGNATLARDQAMAAEQTANAQRDRALKAEAQARQERDRAVAERRRADSEADTANSINDFLQKDLLAQASAAGQAPGGKPDPDIKVRTVLDRAANHVAGRFTGRPQVEASIEGTIGETYRQLGLFSEALLHLQKAFDLDRNALGLKSPGTLAVATQLGRTYRDAGKYPEAESLLRDTVDAYTRAGERSSSPTLTAAIVLANVYISEGKYAEAEPLLTKTLDEARETLGPDHPTTVEAMGVLARVYFVRRRSAEAEQMLLAIIDSTTRTLGPNHPDTIAYMNNLAVLYQRDRRFADAEALYVKVLDRQTKTLGPDHPDTLNVMNNLGVLSVAEGKYSEAEGLYAQVLSGWRKSLGPDHPRTLAIVSNIAVLKQLEGNSTEAEATYKTVLETRRRALGNEHTDTLDSMRLLGALYESESRYSEAEPLFLQTLEARKRVLGAKHADTLVSLADLGELRLDQGKYSESESLLRECLETQKQTMTDDYRLYWTQSLLGASLAGQRRYAEAEPLLVSGFEGMQRRQASVSVLLRQKLRKAAEQIIHLYEGWNKPDKAAEWRKKLDELQAQ